MEFDGKIHIRELEKKNVELKANQSDTWVKKLLARSAPEEALMGMSPEDWAAKVETFDTELRVEKMGSDYLVSGNLQAKVPAPCSRCGDVFFAQRASDFRVVMHRISKEMREQDDTGDPDFVFMRSDEIDVKEVVAEQLIVLEPVAECPEKDEKTGSCRLCHQNPSYDLDPHAGVQILSENTGQGIENSAFSALSQLVQQKNPSKRTTSEKKTKS